MEEALNLSLQQKLQQKLSPLQVRFVRMLEMNGPEVEDEVKHALDDNPALEVAEEPEHEESDFNESAEARRTRFLPIALKHATTVHPTPITSRWLSTRRRHCLKP